MKHLFLRVFRCWLLDRHWTTTYHGYWPSRWAHCACCGRLLFEPHEVESFDIVSPTAKRDFDRAIKAPR